MPMKWLAMLVFIWIASAILGEVIAEGTISASAGIGGNTTYESNLRVLTGFTLTETEETWGVMEVIGSVPDYAQAIYDILSFSTAQKTFLTGTWVYVTWLVLAPIIAASVWGLIYTFIAIFQKALT